MSGGEYVQGGNVRLPKNQLGGLLSGAGIFSGLLSGIPKDQLQNKMYHHANQPLIGLFCFFIYRDVFSGLWSVNLLSNKYMMMMNTGWRLLKYFHRNLGLKHRVYGLKRH